MKFSGRTLASAMLITSLAGCGGGSGGGDGPLSGNSPNPGTTPGAGTNYQPLQGTWAESCSTTKEGSEVNTYTFTGDRAKLLWDTYTDQNCTTGKETAEIVYVYTVGKEFTAASGVSAREIDLVFLEKTGNVEAPARIYDIFRIDGNELFMGVDSGENSGTSPGTRPKDLDFNHVARNPNPTNPDEPNNPTDPAPGTGTTNQALQGNWRTDCIAFKEGSGAIAQTFTGDRLKERWEFFADANCSNMQGSANFVYSYTVGKEVTASPGGKAQEIDLVLLENPDNVEDMDERKYDIFRVDGNALYFGGGGPQTRPTGLNLNLAYRRI